MATCICGTAIEQPSNLGRPRKYCSSKCRLRAHRRRKSLPALMVDRNTWVRRKGKVPYQLSGKKASSTDPSTWSSFDEVAESTLGDGFGIMLGGGLGCYDLDHCLVDGVLQDWARRALEEIKHPIVYVERSMSGDGLHVFVEAEEGRGYRSDGLEFYTRARFIAVTGDTWTEPLPRRPRELSRAERLREQYAEAAEQDAALAILLEETCRLASRLDELDAIIVGKSDFIDLMHFRVQGLDEVQKVHVSIDGVLSEARYQETVLRQYLTTLKQMDGWRVAGNTTPAAEAEEPSESESNAPISIADLAAKRAQRIAGASPPRNA